MIKCTILISLLSLAFFAPLNCTQLLSEENCPTSLNIKHPFALISHIDCDTPDCEHAKIQSDDKRNFYHLDNQNELDQECFLAAVYEHKRIDISGNINLTVETNLKHYEHVARLASQKGAKILITPEDGLFYGERDFIRPVVESVPDPVKDGLTNPCDDETGKFIESQILVRLSCIARNNSLYLVANYGTLEDCKTSSSFCQKRRQFNTDLVFDPKGNLIARYYKINIYLPEPFDAPSEKDKKRRYFDTPFGRFGLMTCFDMIFKNPGIDLVQTDLVDTIIFPTWWFDELPLLTAIQFQQAWSYSMNVNLLAANIHDPSTGSVGSGIYSGHLGPQIHTGPHERQPTLLLASLSAKRSSQCPTIKNELIRLESPNTAEYLYKTMNFSRDSDTVKILHSPNMTRHIECNDGFCCQLSYSIDLERSSDILDSGRIALLIKNSMRKGRSQVWWEQTCFVTTVNNSPYISFNTYQSVMFKSLKLEANFTTNYVYPIFARNVSEMLNIDSLSIQCGNENNVINNCSLNVIKEQQISVIGFYGRLFERDQISISEDSQ